MTDETRNITPPATASHERDDQTTEKSQVKPAESLRTSEIRYRRLFESARDGILILDAQSRVPAFATARQPSTRTRGAEGMRRQ